MRTYKKALTVALLVPVLIVLTTTPAYALFGSILAGIQRAQMIVNQGVQIYKDTMAKITLDGQLTQMTDQFAHLKEQALGSVGALTRSVHRPGLGAGRVHRHGPIVEERLYRRGGGACGFGRTDGRIGQELHPVVENPPVAADTVTESDILACTGVTARSSGRRRPAATSPSVRKATSNWCSGTP